MKSKSIVSRSWSDGVASLSSPREEGVSFASYSASQEVKTESIDVSVQETCLTLKTPNSKNASGKVNLNHLLNFSFPSVSLNSNRSISRRQKTSLAPYSKERYVQAAVRFLVSPGTEIDGDRMDWEKVVAVCVSIQRDGEDGKCPICLEKTCLSPRLTKCGHLFCLPCILRYMDQFGGNYCKCALCNQTAYLRDLKPVVFDRHVSCEVELVMSLNLVVRRRDSSSCFLSDSGARVQAQVPFVDEPRALFNRLAYISSNSLAENLRNEQLELETQFGSCDDVEALFFRSACSMISQAIDRLENIEETEDMFPFEPCEKQEDSVALWYSFYQGSDGQLSFLSSLNYRCLLAEFSSPQALPKSIHGRVLHIESVLLTLENRSKFKFLSHIPIGSTINFVELDLAHLLSPSTLAKFRHELNQRRKKAVSPKLSSRAPQGVFLPKTQQRILVEDTGPALTEIEFPQLITPASSAIKARTPSGWSSIASKGFAAAHGWEPLPSCPVTRDRPKVSWGPTDSGIKSSSPCSKKGTVLFSTRMARPYH